MPTQLFNLLGKQRGYSLPQIFFRFNPSKNAQVENLSNKRRKVYSLIAK